ncbi:MULTISPECIES: LacI family DNA-binding transcriptional regulator [Corynebacterium]|uniref:Transcriptional regulator, LacI family n=2 Tax=Corynebacterium TaxID=1716 RepID=A0ABY6THU9_9CORY|nr:MULTISPECIES: LacI family DNA-binding transcriptional regulator [Corynebacterium]MDK4334551.1 LacI family DNA-binding transcriptional regulator [Corynebacterium accolens]MDK8472643.1 LacI family DNA-binding transcriptional regulator [Corynebacterium accolens]MDK8618677.1 LacI family DNA-binding transcriptional regulator [Corynebacterium accolens]VEH73612.1 transcriptional regulator, LacI family [Corynebacterium segmentosum]
MVKRSPTRKTLASLAAELGVSRTTVSNAYSRPDQLSPATRERILAAAKARGYPGPDPTARSLRTRRAGSVGVLLTEHLSYAFEDMASVDFLAGMAEASAGAQTTLTLIPAGPEGEAEATSLVGSAAVDGFVVYSVAAGDAYLAAARGRGLPLVVCDQPTDAGLPFVGIDDRAAIAPAARALIDAGHRHIGILAIRLRLQRHDGPISWQEVQDAEMHVQRSRVMGALDVFAEAGIAPETVPVVTQHINDAHTTRAAAELLLDAHPELTAVLCTTDSMALGVLAYARERGLSVPEDLSVTGFDGIDAAQRLDLATVIQPNKAKGAAAGHMLEKLIAGATDTAGAARAKAGAVSRGVDEAQAVPRRVLQTRFAPGKSVTVPRPRGR